MTACRAPRPAVSLPDAPPVLPALSADGTLLALAAPDHTVRLWTVTKRGNKAGD